MIPGEPEGDARALDALARRAVSGDVGAVDELVRAVKDDVYRLSMRMLGHPADAEDATQEILLKVVTRLGSFRGESGLRTWVWKVASNHLLTVRRGRREPEGMDFEQLEGMLAAGLAADVPAPSEPDRALLEEEVKLGCTQSMLSCLDREHRLAFILADVFEMTGEEGAEVLGIEPAAFRKRVSRARHRDAGVHGAYVWPRGRGSRVSLPDADRPVDRDGPARPGTARVRPSSRDDEAGPAAA